MAYDNHKNFAYGIVATAPSPATSGTTVILQAGQGNLFPTPPFNLTFWPGGVNAIAANAEISRCTSKSGNTLTIVRAQEGSTARAIVVGDQVSATITVKTLTDLETKLSPTTKRISYYGTPGASPFVTILSAADDSTVLTGRTQTGVTAVGINGMYIYDVDVSDGRTAFIPKWDEGTPSLYSKEYVVV